MMNSFVRTVGVACLACVVGLASEAQGAATMSLKAVAKNGTPLVGGPVNSLNVARGDTITAELYIFGWNTPPFDAPTNSGLVATYNAALLMDEGARSSGADATNLNNLILPTGWVAPLIKDTCPCDDPTYPTCDAAYGCVGAGFNPNNMGSINNTTRTDFIFFGFQSIPGVDVSTVNVRYGGTINGADGQTASRCAGGNNVGGTCTVNGDCPGSTCNAGFLSYAGTLNLKVGSTACGTSTFNISSEPSLTFIGNPEVISIQATPAREGLALTVTGFTCTPPVTGACCDTTNPAVPTCSMVPPAQCTGANKRYGGDNVTCANIQPPCIVQPVINHIVGSNPNNCLIDARRPFPPNTPAQRQGFTSMVLTFQNALGTGEDAPADFTVSQVPPTTPPLPPVIHDVVPGAGNTLTLNFTASPANATPSPIQPNKWTCVTHNASGDKRCIGFLPGDASSNRTAAPADIIDIIDSLNGVRNPALVINQCDLDRSGVCAPADILSEIDMLNGANGYPIQNGKQLEVCPSAAP